MNLSIEKINELKSLHKKERDKRICDRIKAVLLINKGYSYQQVSEILLLDDETVRRHIQEYLAFEKLKTKNKGSDSKLNKQETEELIDYFKVLGIRSLIQYQLDLIINNSRIYKATT